MTNEKIISTIETYISTLENSDKEQYKGALLDFDNNEGRSCYVPIHSLALLVSDLKRELAEHEIKKSKGNTFLKRSKSAENLISKNDNIRKGWIETDAFDNKQQCFMTMYTGFMLSENLSIPMYDEQKEKPFNMARMFKDIPENSVEYDIGKIKAEYKTHKPKAKDSWKCLVKLGDTYFNAEYFIQTVDILAGEPELYLGSGLGASYLISENGKAVIMPVNIKKETESYIFNGEKENNN